MLKIWKCTASNFVIGFPVVLLFLGISSAAFAQDSKSQVAAIKLIRETAKDICYDIEQKGNETQYSVKGDIDAKTAALIKKMINLNVAAGAALNQSWYQGLIREQLGSTIKESIKCRQDVFDTLSVAMLKSVATANASACPSDAMQIQSSQFIGNGIAINVPAKTKLCIVDTKFEGNGKGLNVMPN